LAAVTTTSPLIAEFVKANYPKVEIRASVKMGIGSIQGMDDYFDGWYIIRKDAIFMSDRFAARPATELAMLIWKAPED
jgi:hypothetical protein